MNRDTLKRIIAILLLGSLLLGLIPMIALATEADTTIHQPISTMVLLNAPAEVPDAAQGGDPSVGIIGGADGPTAIFVTGNWGGLMAIAAAVVCAGIAVTVALKNRTK